MHNELEKLEKESNIEWQEYVLKDLFGKSTRGRRLKSSDRIDGELPFVTAGEYNTGISAWIGNDVEVFPENTVTIDMFGSAKYRNYEFGADDHIAVVHTENLSKPVVLYLTAAIHKSSQAGQFDYSRNFYASDADELKIKLPTIMKNDKSEIAFEFMENFISIVSKEQVSRLEAMKDCTLNAYLAVTGFQDSTLTHSEQLALDELNKVSWKTFKIEDILVWQRSIIELNPLHLDSLSISEEKKYPFYGQSTTNNGIIEYRDLKSEVLNNKLGKPTILIHSNNQNIVYLETPFYLKDGHGATSVLQSKYLDKIIAQFLTGSIRKVILQKYEYNAKATKIELKKTEIELPIKSDNTPDYEYMRRLISATQKMVIKNLVLQAEREIEMTRKVINYI